jgi:hypothetical protein
MQAEVEDACWTICDIEDLTAGPGHTRLLVRAGFTEDRAMDVLRTVYMYAHGYALAEACFTACAGCGPCYGLPLAATVMASPEVACDWVCFDLSTNHERQLLAQTLVL